MPLSFPPSRCGPVNLVRETTHNQSQSLIILHVDVMLKPSSFQDLIKIICDFTRLSFVLIFLKTNSSTLFVFFLFSFAFFFFLFFFFFVQYWKTLLSHLIYYLVTLNICLYFWDEVLCILFTFFRLLSSSSLPCLSQRFGRCTLRPSSGGWNVELNPLFRLPG